MPNLDRAQLIAAIEDDLRAVVQHANGPGLGELHTMLAYHLGWEGEGAGPKATGKRVRPLLVLLTCAAGGGDWQQALPAASAVELIHNFSLIHDDIQDDSEQRRGRPTLWRKWGVPQAINAGDAMFALAHLSLEHLEGDICLQAVQLLPRVSLELTQGQYLDLAYEGRQDLTLEDYWPMVHGKTAVLLSACARLGALAAGATKTDLEAYAEFGHKLGLAFQAHDDILGIWGDERQTGKSAYSDLRSGKKSLPVLYGLEHSQAFKALWLSEGKQDVAALADLLRETGALDFAEQTARDLTDEALKALETARPKDGQALQELAQELVCRTW